ncbi:hypothetical protein [Neorhizobium sp. LjRoot104]|uniref:hypothetical protein n=1 Tax=Neorhizobium sp. LjRoot104 TaxID=3342254 RepID=UPI003ECE14AB
MVDKLQVYKQALIHLQAASIVTLTDDVEARYVLDNAWTGVVEEAFSAGDWNAFKVSVALEESVTGTAALGWAYVFDYPDDYSRTVAVSNVPDFRSGFREYADEGGYLHSNTNPMFLRYISKANMTDVATWPTMFWRYVAVKLAFETVGKLTSSDALEAKLDKKLDKALRQAKSVDARNENNKVIGTGSWLRARQGGYGYGDGYGRGGTLVGGEISPGEGDV